MTFESVMGSWQSISVIRVSNYLKVISHLESVWHCKQEFYSVYCLPLVLDHHLYNGSIRFIITSRVVSLMMVFLPSWKRSWTRRPYLRMFHEGPPRRAPYPSHIWKVKETEGNPRTDFLMVFMARGIARGRVSTTTTVELRNMAAMLWQEMQPRLM